MTNFNDLKIKLSLSIGYASAKRTDEHSLSDYFEEDEWLSLSETERAKALDEIADEWSYNYIDIGVSLTGGEHV
ncbi:hypothetical protein [Acinetobacter sp.]|uniref:DUF7167 family protein n=1 Tax=Acinetobacter sp. TaxID=472 RepID=UPI000C443982|nr:hypothetical protein [Acinetobacter sp.]MBC68535.1 hypothetical protein [Acinetobacter sp.]MBT50572.1 hypothetical protein [Acinetobacter sp.]|tara:strand:+ start:103 stop:324 length:222 start_codon:yes stop_codon:yes gene_type:complete